MALIIESDEADRLAHQVAAATGETLTDAVVGSLRERLERLHALQGPSHADQIRRLQWEARELEVRDTRTSEGIVGYDADGVPA